MPARVRVSNIPLHVRKEEFANIFGGLDGCLECRLVNENDRPVGYASFADERFAAMARDAYHMWQGFGNSGLIVEIMMEQRPQAGVMGAVGDGFRTGAMKRPPQDMIDSGGFKQRRGMGGQAEYGGPLQGGTYAPQQGPPSQERYRFAQQQGGSSRFQEGGQYDDYVPAQSQLPAGGGANNFDGKGGFDDGKYGEAGPVGGVPLDQFGGLRVPPELQSQLLVLQQGRQAQHGGEVDRLPDRHMDRPVDRPPPMDRPIERPPIRMESQHRQYANGRPGPGEPYRQAAYEDRTLRRPHQEALDGRGSQFDHPIGGGPGPSEFRLVPGDAPPFRSDRPPFQDGPLGGGGGDGPSPYRGGGGGPPERQIYGEDRGPHMPPPSPFDRSFPVYGAAGRAAAEAVSGTPLPPEARPVIYVEGLPADIAQREVSHIFRPCPGFQRVRLVSKASKVDAATTTMLAFVDFADIASSTNAMHALQGYPLDPEASQTIVLKLKYAIDRHHRPAAYAGGRSGGAGPRGGRGASGGDAPSRGSRGGQGSRDQSRGGGRGRGSTGADGNSSRSTNSHAKSSRP